MAKRTQFACRPVTISLTVEEADELKEIAKREEMSASEWIGVQIRNAARRQLPERKPFGRPRTRD